MQQTGPTVKDCIENTALSLRVLELTNLRHLGRLHIVPLPKRLIPLS